MTTGVPTPSRVVLETLRDIPQPVEMEYLAACVICGSSRFTRILRAKRVCPRRHQGPMFDVCRCRDCGLAFTNPRPSRASIGLFYEDYFDEYMASESEVYGRRAREVLQVAGATVGRVLDVGCGTGAFLVEMARAGWDCVGVEPDAVAAEFARTRHHLTVYLGELDAVTGEAPFDMITLWHTLEHVHEPRACLERCWQLLKVNGVLVVEVPNFGSLQARCFRGFWFALMVPEHVSHFSPATLGRLLAGEGFEVSRIEPSFDRAGWGTSARLLVSDLKHRLAPSRAQARTTAPVDDAPRQALRRPVPGAIDRLQEIVNGAGHFVESRILRYHCGTLAMRAICRKARR